MRRVYGLALAIACTTGLGCASFGFAEPGENSAEMYREMRRAQAEKRAAERRLDEQPERTAADRLEEGDRLRRSGDAARALWAYLQAHEVDPSDARPLLRIGGLHLAREPERAEGIFRELVISTSGSAAARTGLGLALIARGSWEAAIAELQEAIRTDDSLALAHDTLGVALERQGYVEVARQHYRIAAALQPNSHVPLNNLGVSHLSQGETEQAVEMLRRAAVLEPRDPAVHNNLGLALARLGRYDEALASFRKAGDEQAALNNLGYAHYLNGDYDGAMVAYERALLVPGDAEQRRAVLRNVRLTLDARNSAASAPEPTEASPELPAAPAPN